MDKSPDAFRTISEVADDLDLPQHVLRFWETRFPQIKPLKRGGGRRYYRPDDVELLKGIRHLLYDHGYTIKGVQKLLKTNGNKFVMAVATGDVATMEALVAAGQSHGDDPKLGDDDQVVGQPKARASRFFGFGGGDDDIPEVSLGKGSINKEDRALLQETLFDLLECKRLLDQVR
ncbi:MerR family transcriptional regulator [Rhizobium paknamense]|uniref:DNA-binding transcriptional MerR regulator n=1 Tax=Rhizobium paknamense TaxID=1206817 RepID=A0ABU0I9W0_9HYPH|nr:MerR family transcriptional regulator [Rhizobium paknamense]MDQ0454071.1 DNA-binding transcriptional MerR regulator [Rhizobium paknamense]